MYVTSGAVLSNADTNAFSELNKVVENTSQGPVIDHDSRACTVELAFVIRTKLHVSNH